MLEGYFDDSGTHNHSNIVTWAGFIADPLQWKIFDSQWQNLLNKWHIKRFHMYDIVHGDGECVGWSQGQRDLVINEFREVILENKLAGIASAVSKKDWDNIAIPSKHFSYPASAFALSSCLNLSRYYMQNRDTEISFVIDDCFNDDTAVQGAVDFYKSDNINPKLSSLIFAQSQDRLGLQAADMLAWETYRYSMGHLENSLKPTKHFEHFLNSGLLHGEYYDCERIKELVKNARPRTP